MREAASRMKCQNDLKQLVLACHDYESANGHLPVPYSTGDSWVVQVLPYIEQGNNAHKAAEHLAGLIRDAKGKAEVILLENRTHTTANHLLGAPDDKTGSSCSSSSSTARSNTFCRCGARGSIGASRPREGFAVRHLLAVVLAPALCAVLASAAPVPKDAKKDPVCYYPTTVGSKWVYSAAGSDLVLVVSKVEERKGAKVVSVERVDGEKRRLNVVMEVSATGLAITEDGWVKRDPPSAVLKVPFKARDSWDFEHPGLDGVAAQKGTYVVVGVEKVKVPAGTFEAVRLDVDFTTVIGGRPLKSKTNEWYAPHVGLVKMTDENDETATWLLKSFTPGKE